MIWLVFLLGCHRKWWPSHLQFLGSPFFSRPRAFYSFFLRINGNTTVGYSWLRNFVPRIHTRILKAKGQRREERGMEPLSFSEVIKASRAGKGMQRASMTDSNTMQSSSLVPAVTLPPTASPNGGDLREIHASTRRRGRVSQAARDGSH